MRLALCVCISVTVFLFSRHINAGETSDTKKISSADGSISVMVPRNWEQADVKQTMLVAVSPLESPTDMFQENITVIRHSGAIASSQEKFVAAWKGMAKESGATLIEEAKITLNLLPASRIKYSLPIDGVSIAQICYVYLVAVKGTGYEITASTIEPDSSRWLPILDQYVKTITIGKAK